MARRIEFIEERCTHCHLCSLGCSLAFTRNGVFEFRPSLARIRVAESREGDRYAAHVCLQCRDAACQKVCPTGAIGTDTNTGIVEIDHSLCIGCSECVRACEFGGIFTVEGDFRAPCASSCQAGVDCREVLSILSKGREKGADPEATMKRAFQSLTAANPFPAVCGRVCPHPCETACIRTLHDEPLNIHSVERFIGDWAIEKGLDFEKPVCEKRPEKIAIVGSGPAGLSCAYHLAVSGFQVTVFEARSRPGGMLTFAIPPYRLPRETTEAEIDRIRRFGVEIITDVRIGIDRSLDDLKAGFDAVFLAIGAQKGNIPDLPGSDAENIITGLDFLEKVCAGDRSLIKDNVTVIGGGDTAIDVANVCRRLGKKVTVLYRRSEDEMPAIRQHIAFAREEGVSFQFLSAPVEFIQENGRVSALRCIKTKLEGAGADGRAMPVAVPGSEIEFSTELVVFATSQQSDLSGLEEVSGNGNSISVDGHYRTGISGVRAGGDAVSAGLVSIAIGHGRMAAQSIAMAFSKKRERFLEQQKNLCINEIKLVDRPKQARAEASLTPLERRMQGLEVETEIGIARDDLLVESGRCLKCGLRQAVKCEVCDDPLCIKACAVKALAVVDDDHVADQETLYREVRL
jgi:NADPH-dependent glutamate synthase beta subunit-like oxidoreductase